MIPAPFRSNQVDTKIAGHISYKITVVRGAAEIPSLLKAWEELIRGPIASAPQLYQAPEYVRSYLASRSDIEPFIVALWQGEKLKGIAPFYLEKSKFRLRFSVVTLFRVPVRQLKLLGDDVLLAKDVDAELAITAILESIEGFVDAFDLISLECLPVGGPLHKGLTERTGKLKLKVSGARSQVARQLLLPANWSAYLASRSGKTRNNIRRLRSKLEQEFPGTIEFVRISEPNQVANFLTVVDRIFRTTWQGKTFGEKQRDTSEQLHFLENLAKNGWLRSCLLRGAGENLAYVIGFQYLGTFHYQETGYDQKWASLSPGSVLLHVTIEDLFQFQTPQILDFGFGDHLYKRQLGSSGYPACQAYVAATALMKITLGLQRVLDAAYLKIRTQLEHRGWDTKIRSIIKRKGPVAGDAKNPASEN